MNRIYECFRTLNEGAKRRSEGPILEESAMNWDLLEVGAGDPPPLCGVNGRARFERRRGFG